MLSTAHFIFSLQKCRYLFLHETQRNLSYSIKIDIELCLAYRIHVCLYIEGLQRYSLKRRERKEVKTQKKCAFLHGYVGCLTVCM